MTNGGAQRILYCSKYFNGIKKKWGKMKTKEEVVKGCANSPTQILRGMGPIGSGHPSTCTESDHNLQKAGPTFGSTV